MRLGLAVLFCGLEISTENEHHDCSCIEAFVGRRIRFSLPL